MRGTAAITRRTSRRRGRGTGGNFEGAERRGRGAGGVLAVARLVATIRTHAAATATICPPRPALCALVTRYFFSASAPPPLIESRKPRIPSPRPLPSSGSLEGPKTMRQIRRTSSRCVGFKRSPNIERLDDLSPSLLTL